MRIHITTVTRNFSYVVLFTYIIFFCLIQLMLNLNVLHKHFNLKVLTQNPRI